MHQTCSEKKAVATGFEQARDAAFVAAECGVVSNNGFYETDYEYVHVMAQCEGEFRRCGCGECIGSAAQIAQEECGSSVSGQVYLESCFISYSYYPNGMPEGNSSQGRKGTGNGSGRTVAIVLGGAAALLGGFFLLRFFRSCGKKDDME